MSIFILNHYCDIYRSNGLIHPVAIVDKLCIYVIIVHTKNYNKKEGLTCYLTRYSL